MSGDQQPEAEDHLTQAVRYVHPANGRPEHPARDTCARMQRHVRSRGQHIEAVAQPLLAEKTIKMIEKTVESPVNETSQAWTPCKTARKQKMLKTIKVSAMPVAVRLTPSRGGGVPAYTGEYM